HRRSHLRRVRHRLLAAPGTHYRPAYKRTGARSTTIRFCMNIDPKRVFTFDGFSPQKNVEKARSFDALLDNAVRKKRISTMQSRLLRPERDRSSNAADATRTGQSNQAQSGGTCNIAHLQPIRHFGIRSSMDLEHGQLHVLSPIWGSNGPHQSPMNKELFHHLVNHGKRHRRFEFPAGYQTPNPDRAVFNNDHQSQIMNSFLHVSRDSHE
ncbi:unnamed protein product, partial [Nesidiocoris tenuis]